MTTQPFEFEPALKELEAITAWFEQSDVDLDQGLVKFERGMELAAHLKSHLATVENRIEKIKRRFSDTPAAPAETPAEPAPAPETAPETDDDGPSPADRDQAGLFGA